MYSLDDPEKATEIMLRKLKVLVICVGKVFCALKRGLRAQMPPAIRFEQ